MIPLNFLLLTAFLIIPLDLFQIFQTSENPYELYIELFKGEFSVVPSAFFIAYGLAKDRKYQGIRWFFLALVILEGLLGVTQAFQFNGQTGSQLLLTAKQMPFIYYYFYYLLPNMVSCSTRILTAISFQMKKPFFYSYPEISDGQKTALNAAAIGFYAVIAIALFISMMSINMV
jgi:hypothetical protein